MSPLVIAVGISGCRFYLVVFSFVHLSCWSIFFFSSRRRHTRYIGDWSSDVCSSDLGQGDHRLAARLRPGHEVEGDGGIALRARVDEAGFQNIFLLRPAVLAGRRPKDRPDRKSVV